MTSERIHGIPIDEREALIEKDLSRCRSSQSSNGAVQAGFSGWLFSR